MSELTPGFADPVLGAQSCFRAILEAMSRPGRLQRVAGIDQPPAPLGVAAAATMLTLADADTPVWTDAGRAAEDWLRFHAGCPLVASPAEAAFLLATGRMPALATLAQGSEEEPHRSATLIVEVRTLAETVGWKLTGPGIETEHRLQVAGLPADFLRQWAANRRGFPRGVDVVLTAGPWLAALPRTTRIEEA
ncbi:phosphonate C-P lyase system protein PhnH [Siccirubricoccus sp. KC 17139]|uniref:Phosphonate C-P lyase system protein PhnH n=1 Tax=Siccirubricoccus soli TaxID=2899147 RepID=A0ABT1D744_9PROT|nr:phosphonate C-P lyase system protein PhnH [Siccirubricoccus soli]MCO6417422.1 phosphonate C-P lyase system protein PhnH [Siccirubricoccus soli]MCP2683557.1 phosphonate C-P lyase system protein PhnH [Siccirubricoccus soli]